MMDEKQELALLEERVKQLEFGVTRSRTEIRAMKSAFTTLMLGIRVDNPKAGDTFTQRLHALRKALRDRGEQDQADALDDLCEEMQQQYRL